MVSTSFQNDFQNIIAGSEQEVEGCKRSLLYASAKTSRHSRHTDLMLISALAAVDVTSRSYTCKHHAYP